MTYTLVLARSTIHLHIGCMPSQQAEKRLENRMILNKTGKQENLQSEFMYICMDVLDFIEANNNVRHIYAKQWMFPLSVSKINAISCPNIDILCKNEYNSKEKKSRPKFHCLWDSLMREWNGDLGNQINMWQRKTFWLRYGEWAIEEKVGVRVNR